jgi:hypothetical protein
LLPFLQRLSRRSHSRFNRSGLRPSPAGDVAPAKMLAAIPVTTGDATEVPFIAVKLNPISRRSSL